MNVWMFASSMFDELASRFHKLEGSSIRVEALALYVERFKMALIDFTKMERATGRLRNYWRWSVPVRFRAARTGGRGVQPRAGRG